MSLTLFIIKLTSPQKVNPQLLYWQRVDMPIGAVPTAKNLSRKHTAPVTKQGPRPPSYISDDGVSYVVGAEPRNVINLQRPPTEMHPAYRV